MIDKSVMSNNTSTGVVANVGFVLLGNSVVSGNATGVSMASGGTIFSYTNNSVTGNGNENLAALSTLAQD